MSRVVAREFGSKTLAEKDESGLWKITTSMTEKRKLDGNSDWEVKELSASALDSDFGSAYQVAMDSVLSQLEELLKETNGDGMLGPVEGEEEEIKEEE